MGGTKLFWDDKRARVCGRVCYELFSRMEEGEFQEVGNGANGPSRPPVNVSFGGIRSFMEEKCDFSMEHADGSFMDHLEFVRDYSCAHLPSRSPRILFLHSIMGVATNKFPMGVELIPELKSLLSTEEFSYVEAFPSILRLIKGTDLLQDIYERKMQGGLAGLKGLRMKRLLDGAPIELSMDKVWVMLNMLLIHSLDFLPALGFLEQSGDPFWREFVELYALLTACDRLEARVILPAQCWTAIGEAAQLKDCVGVDPEKNAALGGRGRLDGRFWNRLRRALPVFILRNKVRKNIIKFSDLVGFPLEYQWVK